MGHQSPGYAAAQHVQDAVDHLTQVCGSGMASGGVGRQQGSQFVPLGIGVHDVKTQLLTDTFEYTKRTKKQKPLANYRGNHPSKPKTRRALTSLEIQERLN